MGDGGNESKNFFARIRAKNERKTSPTLSKDVMIEKGANPAIINNPRCPYLSQALIELVYKNTKFKDSKVNFFDDRVEIPEEAQEYFRNNIGELSILSDHQMDNFLANAKTEYDALLYEGSENKSMQTKKAEYQKNYIELKCYIKIDPKTGFVTYQRTHVTPSGAPGFVAQIEERKFSLDENNNVVCELTVYHNGEDEAGKPAKKIVNWSRSIYDEYGIQWTKEEKGYRDGQCVLHVLRERDKDIPCVAREKIVMNRLDGDSRNVSGDVTNVALKNNPEGYEWYLWIPNTNGGDIEYDEWNAYDAIKKWASKFAVKMYCERNLDEVRKRLYDKPDKRYAYEPEEITNLQWQGMKKIAKEAGFEPPTKEMLR